MLRNFIADWPFGIMKHRLGEISGAHDVEEVGVAWLYYVEASHAMVTEPSIKSALSRESSSLAMIIDKRHLTLLFTYLPI
jgi:hypothetical protein